MIDEFQKEKQQVQIEIMKNGDFLIQGEAREKSPQPNLASILYGLLFLVLLFL